MFGVSYVLMMLVVIWQMSMTVM